jgi:hypothetical protein
MTDMPQQRQSGQIRSAACRALSSTVEHLKTSSRQFEPRTTVIFRCRCVAEATTGPVEFIALGIAAVGLGHLGRRVERNKVLED